MNLFFISFLQAHNNTQAIEMDFMDKEWGCV